MSKPISQMIATTLIATIFVSNVLAETETDNEIAFDVISSGQFSGVTHQMSMVVQDAMNFEMLWHHHSQSGMVTEAMPKVDFANETVIAHFLGSGASCGYDVQTTEIENRTSYVEVKSLTTTPKHEMTCLVATQPYEMIKTKRLNKLVGFKQKVRSR